MKSQTKEKRTLATRRAARARARTRGSSERPRLSVFRSSKHIYAQIINDLTGKTLAAADDTALKTVGKKPVEIAHAVGLAIAEKAKSVGITSVVFDRGAYRYHGRVAAIADGAREGGLNF